MKITVFQQDKQIKIIFKQGTSTWLSVNSERSRRIDTSTWLSIDKADDFLLTLDRFLKKSTMDITVLKKANLKFVNVSILTERIIRAIIAGLRF